jgi:hypothetical protein
MEWMSKVLVFLEPVAAWVGFTFMILMGLAAVLATLIYLWDKLIYSFGYTEGYYKGWRQAQTLAQSPEDDSHD